MGFNGEINQKNGRGADSYVNFLYRVVRATVEGCIKT